MLVLERGLGWWALIGVITTGLLFDRPHLGRPLQLTLEIGHLPQPNSLSPPLLLFAGIFDIIIVSRVILPTRGGKFHMKGASQQATLQPSTYYIVGVGARLATPTTQVGGLSLLPRPVHEESGPERTVEDVSLQLQLTITIAPRQAAQCCP